MESSPVKKILICYVITSALIFLVSATGSALGLFGYGIVNVLDSLSIELHVLFQLALVLVANLALHAIFYFGGLRSAPILRGIGIGAFLGLIYFLTGVFALDLYDIHAEPLQHLVSAMGGSMFEYCTGGIATAMISVSDIHRWGLLRAF